LKTKILITALLVLLFLASTVFTEEKEEEKSPTAGVQTMVRSSDGKHKVLKDACTVCHKEEEFEFLIMIYSTKKKIKIGEEEVLVGPDQPTETFSGIAEGLPNFHVQMNCLFCHQPDLNQKPIPDKFIYLGSGISSLCKTCHIKVEELHFVSEEGKTIKSLKEIFKGYGLSLSEDKTVSCVTCHTIHSEKSFGRSVRAEFKTFIKESIFYNPHGKLVSCEACHAIKPMPNEEVTYIDDNYEKICEKCHGDKHHVTGVTSSEKTYPMDFLDFPLYNETLFCSTCHDEVCYKKLYPENKNFLTGGPYKSNEEFCTKCHKKELSKEINPHKQLDESGDLMKDKCSLCHIKFIEEGDDDIALVSPVLDICSKCHVVYDHPDLNHLVELKGVKEENLENYQENYEIHFPLSDAGEITCATCHNPHDKGIIKGLGGVGAGEYMLLRGVSFEEACTPCHGKIY
jgi:hypothetical protein